MTGRHDNRKRGYQSRRPPLIPEDMVGICRALAADLRAEHAAGWGGIALTGAGRGGVVSRAEAAVSMDEQADRWAVEAAGGERNMHDRVLIGIP